MTDTCASCRFFFPRTTVAFPDADGMCRRHAPRGPVIGCSKNGFQIFPTMQSGQWCGEFLGPISIANQAQGVQRHG